MNQEHRYRDWSCREVVGGEAGFTGTFSARQDGCPSTEGRVELRRAQQDDWMDVQWIFRI